MRGRCYVVSDDSGGSGWWLASDHEWYPPDLHPSVEAKQSELISQRIQGLSGGPSLDVDESPSAGKRGRLAKRSIVWSLAILAVVAATLPLTADRTNASAIISESIVQ